MTLTIDVTKAPRSPMELLTLVAAVQQAHDEDEADWIEWKSGFDLGAKEVRATLARHIIGMANRRVEEAARFAEGFGYILVGVEPGKRHGVSRIDLADLDAGLAPYLGPRGPRWTAAYETTGGPAVLVITIDPPRAGDAIHTLHRDYDRLRAGDVFVRKLARTERAGPGDIDYLAQRAAPRRKRLDLDVNVLPPVPVVPPLAGLGELLDSWLACQRERLLACLDEPPLGPRHPADRISFYGRREHEGLKSRGGWAHVVLTDLEMAALRVIQGLRNPRGIIVWAERRAPREYWQQVEHYLTYLRYELMKKAHELYLDQVGPAFSISVRNPSDLNLRSVRGTIGFPWDCVTARPERDSGLAARMPPRPYGPLVKTPIWTPASGPDASDRGWERPWAGYRFGGPGETFMSGVDMRPLAAHRSDISLFLAEPAGTQVTARWELTATNVDGRLDGELTVRVGDQPVDAACLLAGTLARLPAHLQGPWTLWPGTLRPGA